jgi:uncharacterized membrane protein
MTAMPTLAAPAALPAVAPLARRARIAALACLLALIALGLAWELVLAPTGRGALVLKVLPLLLPLPGLWRGRRYTFRWTCLLLWLYVTEGVVRATSDPAPGALLGSLEVALSLGLFAACAAYIRGCPPPASHDNEMNAKEERR